MDTGEFLRQMKEEYRRLGKAIAALEGDGDGRDGGANRSPKGQVGRPRLGKGKGRKRRGISKAGRARIAAAQKARWAKLKEKKLKEKAS